MSPESLDSVPERAVSAAIDAAIRRARVLALAEALAWGLSAAAISVASGAVLAVGIAVWRWRSITRVSIVRVLERADPEARNLIVTADELAGGALAAKPIVRARVFADAAAGARRIDLRRAFPIARLTQVVVLAVVAWAAVMTAHLWRGQLPRAGAGMQSQSAASAGTVLQPRLQLRVAVQPPPYTGLKDTATVVDPEQLQAVEGSALVVSIDASANSVSIEHDGRARSLTRGADGRFAARVQVAKTGYLLVTADDGARRLVPVIVSPDALPAVRVTAPGRDLVYAGGNPRIVFDARATDDYGLRSLVLRYTRVTGAGENYEFKEGEIPLALKPASAREWTGSASRSLAELALKDGDMLVYRAVASDARPGDGSATSDAFFIEISKLGVAAGDAFTLPREESKYALSQQMLIVKTERLQQRRGSLSANDLAEQSLNLAVEQRMIRAEFVFMRGGEVDDEEVEAEQSVELQAGRLQNRGQRDLRAATIAMSQAEKLLTGANTAAALIAERAAVTALQRAFSRNRYILRAMASRSQLDAARRLTGTLAEVTGWKRTLADAPVNRRAALLEDVLRGIAAMIALRLKPDTTATVRLKPDTTETTLPNAPVVSGFSPTRALVLAEEAIRIDPASASLRDAAAALQRAAAATNDVRAKALSEAAAAVAAEARRAQADAPSAPLAIAPALAGAFADALRRPR